MKLSKKITIYCKDLGGDSVPTLILTFDQQKMPGIYEDFFPTVWRMASFPKYGSYSFAATYNDQLVFTAPQIDNGNATSASTWIDVELGQQTNLVEEPRSKTKSFTPPINSGDSGTIKATNKTDIDQTIGIGFDSGSTPPPTVLVFEGVKPTHTVTAQFTPTLSAYIAFDHEENEVLHKAMSLPIWEKDLNQLAETSTWRLVHDDDSKTFSIIPA